MRRLVMIRDQIKGSWWGMILAEHDTEPVEMAGGLLKVSIGFWLLLPFDTFGSSPTFRALAVMPEWLWGSSLIVVGLLHLHALMDGDRRRRWRGSMVGFVVWFAMAFVFVATNPPALGWIAFMGAALGQMWASLRLGGPD